MELKEFLKPTVWKLLLFPIIFFSSLSLPGVSLLPNNIFSYLLMFALSYLVSCAIMKIVCKLEKKFEKADLKTLVKPNTWKLVIFLFLVIWGTWQSHCLSCPERTNTRADANLPICTCDYVEIVRLNIAIPFANIFEAPARQFSMGLYSESFLGFFIGVIYYLIFFILPYLIFYVAFCAVLFIIETVAADIFKKKKVRSKR